MNYHIYLCSSSRGGGSCGNKYPDASCNGWANSGFCSGRYEEFMSENCKEAYNLCEGGGSGTCENEYTAMPVAMGGQILDSAVAGTRNS